MEQLRRKLPPMNALVVFEAAARLLNFTHAAKELRDLERQSVKELRRADENIENRFAAARADLMRTLARWHEPDDAS